MSVPRDLHDVLYKGVTVDDVPLTEEMMALIIEYAKEITEKALRESDERGSATPMDEN